MTDGIRVVPPTPDGHAGVLRIADALPDWFTGGGRARIRPDPPFQQDPEALDAAGGSVGSLLFYAADGVGHIGWMEVDPAMHRRGAGRSLVGAAEERLAAAGVGNLDVSTLGDGAEADSAALVAGAACDPPNSRNPASSMPSGGTTGI